MTVHLALLALGHVHGHYGGRGAAGGGVSDVLRTIAHAAIWSTVGRIIWHAPVWLVIGAFVLGGLYLINSGRRRRAGRS